MITSALSSYCIRHITQNLSEFTCYPWLPVIIVLELVYSGELIRVGISTDDINNKVDFLTVSFE